ncbi:MAG: c-type cytochrome [Gammaproteobacteria bacterium]
MEKTGISVRYAATLALGTLLVTAGPANAADPGVADVGKERYMDYCAVCHGPDATGGGPLANVLNKVPSNLTMLSKNNGGEFPFNTVYDMIDGRDMPVVHGTNEMPIWGGEWRQKSKLGSETELRGRILEIIVYLRSIQQ